MNKYRDLTEEFDISEAMSGVGIDDANGILKNVVILTANKVSQNKTYYTMKALEEAVTRYDRDKMFIDHPTEENRHKNRSLKDFGGVYQNLHIDGNKLKGDVVLAESARRMVMDIAKLKPSGVGLSIKDRGHGTEKDGVFFVEGFAPKAIHSIDLVCEPSVNKDLFEAAKINDEGGCEMDFKALKLEDLSKERPDLIESIQNAGKAAVLKELEEAKATGLKSESIAAKMGLLLEADFSKEVREAVKMMIMPDAIGLDAAKAIITGQKALVEAMKKVNPTTTVSKDPKVTALGARAEGEVEEAAKDLPDEKMILEAFGRRS